MGNYLQTSNNLKDKELDILFFSAPTAFLKLSMSPLLEREGENHVLPLKSAVTPGIVQDFLFGEGIDLKENSLHRLMFGDFVSSW